MNEKKLDIEKETIFRFIQDNIVYLLINKEQRVI